MKRSKPDLRSSAEIKADGMRNYAVMEKDKPKINPIFLRAHYPKMEGVKENVN